MLKRAISCTLSALVLLSCILLCSCGSVKSKKEAETDNQNSFEQNWEIDSGRYYKSGRLISESKGDGFVFEADENGGIHVTAGEGTGYVPTTILKSKNKTALDNLSVNIKPKTMDFTNDDAKRSQVITVMWTTDPLLPMDEALGHYDYTATNGIRNAAQPTKGLCIVLNNSYDEYAGTMTASNLMITMIDGDFHDIVDHRIGYRWSFTARNFLSQSPYSDDTKIISPYEKIDITDGFNVAVRPDDTHGYIVSVNGIDYYSSDKISYYPNNVSNQYSDDSMTSAKQDIDLSALTGAGDGYVNVAVSGNLCDAGMQYDFTLAEINGVPAALWAGESAK